MNDCRHKDTELLDLATGDVSCSDCGKHLYSTGACAHLDQEPIYEWHDGYPCLVEVRCENCEADVISNYTEKERAEMERDELSFQYDEQYESAKEAWLESLREAAE